MTYLCCRHSHQAYSFGEEKPFRRDSPAEHSRVIHRFSAVPTATQQRCPSGLGRLPVICVLEDVYHADVSILLGQGSVEIDVFRVVDVCLIRQEGVL